VAAKELIIASAVKMSSGIIFAGKRHSDAQMNGALILGEDDYNKEKVVECGFLTSSLRFLNRKEAYILAKFNGQYKRGEIQKAYGIDNVYDRKKLFSEDLW
jgi:hypothetical protein